MAAAAVNHIRKIIASEGGKMLHSHLITHTAPAASPENTVVFRDKRVTVLGPRLFRIEVSKQTPARFCDDATQVVWFRDTAPVPFLSADTGTELCIRTEEAILKIPEDVFSSTVTLPGSGEIPIIDQDPLPGTYRTLDCADGDLWIHFNEDTSRSFRIRLESGVTSRSGVTILDDSRSLILGKDGMIRAREFEETDLYVFAFGHDYRSALRALYQISGPIPVIPRYAFGNWWSRYHAYTQQEYLDLMDSFAERDIPFTVATIDMDWHPSHDLPDGASGWTGYSWNRELFPDHRAFLAELHEKDLHVTMNLHPALGVRPFEDSYREMAERMGIDPEKHETIPFDMTDDRFINAYFDVLHKPYEHEGVDFWWIDWQQGTRSKLAGLDPLWSLNHYHFHDIQKEKDGLILSRYAGLGSHRYPLGFSGDTYMTWNSLRFLPFFTSSASNAGYTWWSHDIGGHMKGEKNDELYVRFIQFGVFSPINRIHSSNNPLLEKDPAFYPGGTGLIAREFLKLRHAMIPFLYSAAVQTSEEGLPLIEPMYYPYPEEEDAYNCPGQYMFGGQLLAAPITEKSVEDGFAKKDVWLPEGTWTDFFTGNVYTGKRWQTMVRGLESFPLLLKEGGFFVLDSAPKKNSIRLPERLKVAVTAGSGRYTLTEDEHGTTVKTVFESLQLDENSQKITIIPDRKLSFDLEFRNVLRGAVRITADEKEIPCRPRVMNGFTKVSLEAVPAGTVLVITVREQAGRKEKRDEMILRVMLQIQSDNGLKERIYHKLLEAESRIQYEAVIALSGLTETDKLRLEEIEWL